MATDADTGIRIRSAVILLRDGHVALIERERDGQRYYLFPGGGVEDSESLQAAARREALEELGVATRVGRLVAVSDTPARKQYYFSAEIVGGRFGTGAGEELKSSADSRRGSYNPMWVKVADLRDIDVRPASLRDFIVDGELEGMSGVLDVKD